MPVALRWCLEDPDYYDAKIAGWWLWGACAWIGSGWCICKGRWSSNGVELSDSRSLPVGNAGIGTKRSLPHLGNAGVGINRKLPGGARRNQFILEWFSSLAQRLRDVRFTCGDWARTLSPSVTVRHGLTAVFLDPPYGADSVATRLYSQEADVAASVRAWCAEHGGNPKLRIALCGYDREHELPGWTVVPGRATSGAGYGNTSGNTNHKRERIWFSPHCVNDLRGSKT